MSTMEKQRAGPVLAPGRSRRSFAAEFKADAVSLVLDHRSARPARRGRLSHTPAWRGCRSHGPAPTRPPAAPACAHAVSARRSS